MRILKGYEIISRVTKYLLGQSLKRQKVERTEVPSGSGCLLKQPAYELAHQHARPHCCPHSVVCMITALLSLPPSRTHSYSQTVRENNLKFPFLIKLDTHFPSCWLSFKDRNTPEITTTPIKNWRKTAQHEGCKLPQCNKGRWHRGWQIDCRQTEQLLCEQRTYLYCGKECWL